MYEGSSQRYHSSKSVGSCLMIKLSIGTHESIPALVSSVNLFSGASQNGSGVRTDRTSERAGIRPVRGADAGPASAPDRRLRQES